MKLIRNIKFRKIRNTFQEKLKENIKIIKESNKTITSADKNSRTSTYKKRNSNIKKQINMAGKNLLRDKMETSEEGNSFITIKKRKENFDNHPTVRLINPAKMNLGE